MHRLILLMLLSIFLVSPQAVRSEDEFTYESSGDTTFHTTMDSEQNEGHSFLHKLIFYVPNRVLDVLDIMRLRVRVGPGLAAGVRATRVAEVYVGSYASIYAGLPGPRNRCLPKLPIGLESSNGVSVSAVDATLSGGIGPDYSATEFGFSLHPLIFGLDVGVDPWEAVDFMAGIFFIDIEEDDL